LPKIAGRFLGGLSWIIKMRLAHHAANTRMRPRYASMFFML